MLHRETLYPHLSPSKDMVSQTKHFALKVFIALTLPGISSQKTGARTAPALGFFSPSCTPGCLTGGRAVSALAVVKCESNFRENFVILKAMELFQMELTPT